MVVGGDADGALVTKEGVASNTSDRLNKTPVDDSLGLTHIATELVGMPVPFAGDTFGAVMIERGDVGDVIAGPTVGDSEGLAAASSRVVRQWCDRPILDCPIGLADGRSRKGKGKGKGGRYRFRRSHGSTSSRATMSPRQSWTMLEDDGGPISTWKM
jgi:hypothetical protein